MPPDRPALPLRRTAAGLPAAERQQKVGLPAAAKRRQAGEGRLRRGGRAEWRAAGNAERCTGRAQRTRRTNRFRPRPGPAAGLQRHPARQTRDPALRHGLSGCGHAACAGPQRHMHPRHRDPRRFLAGRLDAPAERRPRARRIPATQRRQRVLHDAARPAGRSS